MDDFNNTFSYSSRMDADVFIRLFLYLLYSIIEQLQMHAHFTHIQHEKLHAS